MLLTTTSFFFFQIAIYTNFTKSLKIKLYTNYKTKKIKIKKKKNEVNFN